MTIAGIKKFHDYLYGHQFLLVTDHKPLLGILAGDRQTPPILSLHMLRWPEFLSAYSYHLIHRAGKHVGHVDSFSRCQLPLPVQDPALASTILLVEDLDLPLSAEDIACFMCQDRVLSQVFHWVVMYLMSSCHTGDSSLNYRSYKAVYFGAAES